MAENGTELTFDAVRAQFDAAWQRFVSAIDSVPPDRLDEPGLTAEWSVRLLVGHVAFWDGFEADHLWHRDEMPTVDWQALNDRNIADIAARPYADLRQELFANHARLAEEMREPLAISLERLRALTCDHYLEHGAEIDAWLAK